MLAGSAAGLCGLFEGAAWSAQHKVDPWKRGQDLLMVAQGNHLKEYQGCTCHFGPSAYQLMKKTKTFLMYCSKIWYFEGDLKHSILWDLKAGFLIFFLDSVSLSVSQSVSLSPSLLLWPGRWQEKTCIFSHVSLLITTKTTTKHLNSGHHPGQIFNWKGLLLGVTLELGSYSLTIFFFFNLWVMVINLK